MKKLLIALIALTMTLGVACKKSNDVADSKPAIEVKKEVTSADLKPKVVAVLNPGDFGGDGGDGGGSIGGANSYPHFTGACTCGKYAICHPKEYLVWKWLNNEIGHYVPYLTQPGQTTFPEGAIFPGNNPE